MNLWVVEMERAVRHNVGCPAAGGAIVAGRWIGDATVEVREASSGHGCGEGSVTSAR